MNISFIGFGNLAKSIARGLCNNNTHFLSAAAPSLTAGINKDTIHTHYLNKVVVKNADIIILAVKPAQMADVLKEIIPDLPPHSLLISVAAGLTLSWYADYCGAQQAIIRTMPNIPVSVGLGATPMIANKAVSSEQKKSAEFIFSTIGITTWIYEETQIDSFTALSGSGPAYVFLFLEAMIQAGVILGIEESTATTFALQTLNGALKLAQMSDLSLTQLRRQVTSPGGTTEAAIKVLEPLLDDLLLAAMNAAKCRSSELGQIF
jgi:pyrroline-5-carboxylate reductase